MFSRIAPLPAMARVLTEALLALALSVPAGSPAVLASDRVEADLPPDPAAEVTTLPAIPTSELPLVQFKVPASSPIVLKKGPVTLRATGRPGAKCKVVASTSANVWRTVRPCAVAKTGRVKVTVRPSRTAKYSIVSASETSARSFVRVRVIPGVRVVLLAGQSNAYWIDERASLLPELRSRYGTAVRFVKHAKGGSSINRWLNSGRGRSPHQQKLVADARAVIHSGVPVRSVTLLWVQGERDARDGMKGSDYHKRLGILARQVRTQLGLNSMGVALARLHEYGSTNPERYPTWARIRAAQVRFARERQRVALVDSDGLPAGKSGAATDRGRASGVHHSVEGYQVLGERLAAAAIEVAAKTPTPRLR